MKNSVIEFDSKERIVKKARSYVESVETSVDESDRAIPLLLKAMKLADQDLKREIILLLGSFAKEAARRPGYRDAKPARRPYLPPPSGHGPFSTILHMHERLRDESCSKINLQVRSDNAEVIEFYKHIGATRLKIA